MPITPCPGFASYSAGSTGSSGVPLLVSSGGRPDPGNTAFQLDLSSAKTSSLVVFVLGVAKTSIPWGGGVIAVSPGAMLFNRTSGSGTTVLPLGIPPSNAIRGLSIFAQSGVDDAAATGNVALSNAIEIKICQ